MLPNLPLNTIFQPDGAPPHYRLAVRQVLDENLPGAWIGRRGRTPWPARSLDLTSFDVLMGRGGRPGQQNTCPSFTELKRRTTLVIRSIRVKILKKYGIAPKTTLVLL